MSVVGPGEVVQTVKSTGRSSRGPGFDSQCLQDSSQPSITPGSGDPMSSGFTRYWAHTDVHADKTPIHIT